MTHFERFTLQQEPQRVHWEPRWALVTCNIWFIFPAWELYYLIRYFTDQGLYILVNLPNQCTLIKHVRSLYISSTTMLNFPVSQYTINDFRWIPSHTALENFVSNHPEWKSFEFQTDVHCTTSCTSAWRSGFILGVTAVWSAPTYSSLKRWKTCCLWKYIRRRQSHLLHVQSKHFPLPFPMSLQSPSFTLFSWAGG